MYPSPCYHLRTSDWRSSDIPAHLFTIGVCVTHRTTHLPSHINFVVIRQNLYLVMCRQANHSCPCTILVEYKPSLVHSSSLWCRKLPLRLCIPLIDYHFVFILIFLSCHKHLFVMSIPLTFDKYYGSCSNYKIPIQHRRIHSLTFFDYILIQHNDDSI